MANTAAFWNTAALKKLIMALSAPNYNILPGNLDETSKGETKEGVNDPLTEGDLASHRIIVKGMMKAFPQLNLVR